MKKVTIYTLICSFILLLHASCVKDSLDDCPPTDITTNTTIRFDYSWNMLSVNAFADQVDEVVLFVFDESGMLYRTYHDQGEHVKSNNYAAKLSGLPSGKYEFVALANNVLTIHNRLLNFSISPMVVGVSKISDLFVTLHNTKRSSYFDLNLNNLLIGHLSPSFISDATDNRLTLSTKKINNNVRVVLIDTADKPISVDDYSVHIEEHTGNSVINHKYEVHADGFGLINYYPYYNEKVTAKEGEFNNGNAHERFNAVASEFAMFRLIENHDVRLIVTDNKTGKEIVNRNLLDLIYLLKSEGHISGNMSFQEYLDRNDNFALTLYVNGDTSTWLNTTIVINGWVINLIDIEL